MEQGNITHEFQTIISVRRQMSSSNQHFSLGVRRPGAAFPCLATATEVECQLFALRRLLRQQHVIRTRFLSLQPWTTRSRCQRKRMSMLKEEKRVVSIWLGCGRSVRGCPV